MHSEKHSRQQDEQQPYHYYAKRVKGSVSESFPAEDSSSSSDTEPEVCVYMYISLLTMHFFTCI